MADYSFCVGMALPSLGQRVQQPNRFLSGNNLDPFHFQRGRYNQYQGQPQGVPRQSAFELFPYHSPLNPSIPGLLPNETFNIPSAWLAPLFGVLAYIESVLSNGNLNIGNIPEALPTLPWVQPQPALPQNIQNFIAGKVTRNLPPFKTSELEKLNPTKDPIITDALNAVNTDAQGRILLEQMLKNQYTMRRDVIPEDVITEEGVSGYTDPEKREVVISKGLNSAEGLLSTIGHEFFHVLKDLPGDLADSQREESLSEIGGQALAIRILGDDPLRVLSSQQVSRILEATQYYYPQLPAVSKIQDSIRATGIQI